MHTRSTESLGHSECPVLVSILRTRAHTGHTQTVWFRSECFAAVSHRAAPDPSIRAAVRGPRSSKDARAQEVILAITDRTLPTRLVGRYAGL